MVNASARPLTIYVRLWAIANLLRIHVGYAASTALRGSQLDRYSVALPLIIVSAALWPTRRAGQLTFVALALRAITNIAKGSHMSNSQLWATQHDLALLLALAAAALRKGSLETLTAADEREIIAECAPTICLQMAIFYFASGFWKLNTSFLHSDYSCASLYLVSQLEYLPDHILFTETLSFVARAIARLAPFVTIAVELALPLLHAFEPSAKMATLGTLAFHLAIGLTPPPSNVASYGSTCRGSSFRADRGRRRRRRAGVVAARRRRGGSGGMSCGRYTRKRCQWCATRPTTTCVARPLRALLPRIDASPTRD